MTGFTPPVFIDNPAIHGREDRYASVLVRVDAILESWRLSLFSYEWILPDGRIRQPAELSPGEQSRRATIESALNNGKAIEKPVLGIGLMDNVEIGSGRAVFLTLAAHGCKTLPVHVPKSSIKEFDPFLA